LPAHLTAALTQKEFAKHRAVDVCTVRNWEAGRARPAGRRLQALAQLFSVSVVPR